MDFLLSPSPNEPSTASANGLFDGCKTCVKRWVLGGLRVARERTDERPELPAPLGQAVLDQRRPRIDHGPLQHAGLLEVGEALGQRRGRDRAERLQELVE